MTAKGASTKRDIKVWEPNDAEELTRSVINLINWDIREGNPDPVQSRRVLQYFMEYTDNDRVSLPREVFDFLRMGIAAYLANPRDGVLERALGLRKKRNRPKEMERRNHQIAWDVLRERLKGSALRHACIEVASKYHIGDNKISDIWAKHKGDVLCFESMNRVLDSENRKALWSEPEVARLKKIYGAGIIDAPPKSPDKPGGSK